MLELLLAKLDNITLSSEDKYFFRVYGPIISKLKRNPVLEARLLLGIVVPPHERSMLRALKHPTREAHFVGSRGSAKSFVIASLTPVLESLVTSRRKYLSLSASKFRGGKVIMEEALSALLGELPSQQPLGNFAKLTLLHKAGLKRESDRWNIPFSTGTIFYTVPTGSTDTIRGLRAQWLALDEADNWDNETVNTIIKPFLAVGIDFESPGGDEISNKIVFTGTVSYSHKDWAKKLKDRMHSLQKRYEAYQALYSGDHERYNSILSEDNEKVKHLSTLVQFWDYTDLVIPTKLKNHAVYYPVYQSASEQVEVNPDTVIKYDNRDKCDLIYTYPVNKEIAEDELDDGLSDFDSWAAEWRCHFIETSGNVYPFHLVERSVNTELLDSSEASRKGWNIEQNGPYYPPLLYECEDPCVLGVDPARTDDFAGFVVIRMGELAKGDYNPKTHQGKTPYNNVIWAEQRRGLTNREVADKILEFKRRYNLYLPENPEKAPAVVIDARGAASGTTIRDDLARPVPPVDEFGNIDYTWKEPQKIYDPTDPDYKELRISSNSWPGLRLLWTSDQINTELVSFSKGQLETSRLYIAKDIERRFRNDPEDRLHVGYLGVRSLKHQLVSIQSSPTKYHQTFYMAGNVRSVENKKDLFSAFLYACYALRAHLTMSILGSKKQPTTVGYSVKIGGGSRKSLSNLIRL